MTDQSLEEFTFEAALTELEDLVARLEDGELPLDKSLQLFERGQLLSKRCNELLDAAELKVKQLAPGDGELTAFDED